MTEETNAAKKDKGFTITVTADEIIGADIMKSGDYKYASVGIKKGENERIRISYEWKGDGVPDFVMGLMQFIQANQEEIDKNKEEYAEEYAELKERI